MTELVDQIVDQVAEQLEKEGIVTTVEQLDEIRDVLDGVVEESNG